MHILVTGGTGYIGSHSCVALMAVGHEAGRQRLEPEKPEPSSRFTVVKREANRT